MFSQCSTILCLLAQNDAPPPMSSIWTIVFPAILIFFLFQLFFAQSPQKREQKHIEQLKSSLKKNDLVVTAGGILGTVANVDPAKNEVTIKVDDNTRLRVLMRSVSLLPKDDGKEAKPEPPPVETK